MRDFREPYSICLLHSIYSDKGLSCEAKLLYGILLQVGLHEGVLIFYDEMSELFNTTPVIFEHYLNELVFKNLIQVSDFGRGKLVETGKEVAQ